MSLKTDAFTRTGSTLHTTLYPTEHFSFAQSLEFMQSSGAVNHLDQVNDDKTQHQRPLRLGDRVFWVVLESPDDKTLTITVAPADDAPPPEDTHLQQAIQWANRRFFLDLDMGAVQAALSTNAYGEELITRYYPGRPANYPSAWEALVRSVVHSRIFPGLAQKLDAYLCETYGTAFTYQGQIYHLIPTPEQLAKATPDDLRAARFSRQKAEYLVTFSQQILDEPDVYDFEAMTDLPGDEIVERLSKLHGVGPWTAQNVAMRGVPHLDVFIDEKTTRETLTPYFGKDGKITKKQVADSTSNYAPYRSIVCYYTYMKHFDM